MHREPTEALDSVKTIVGIAAASSMFTYPRSRFFLKLTAHATSAVKLE